MGNSSEAVAEAAVTLHNKAAAEAVTMGSSRCSRAAVTASREATSGDRPSHQAGSLHSRASLRLTPLQPCIEQVPAVGL